MKRLNTEDYVARVALQARQIRRPESVTFELTYGWHMTMRPLLQRLTTAVLSEAVGVLSPTHTPLHTTQRSTSIGKQ